MITELKLHDWKSFADALLYIDPLTFVIGINASGKSNIFDALDFLHKMAEGIPVGDIIATMRGGEEWVLRKGTRQFALSVKVQDGELAYLYSVAVGLVHGTFRIISERLEKQTDNLQTKTLFATAGDMQDSQSSTITTSFLASRGEKRLELNRDTAAISQIGIIANTVIKEIRDAAVFVLDNLKRIFVLNPMPSAMRGYASLAKELLPDASNVAGVLADMNEKQKQAVEKLLTKYIRPLPERDLNAVWAEKVGRFGKDAMLYCEENWLDGPMQLDAKGMSDGTLRFIAIVMALLTVSPGSLLVIEEIDNGLHPSRAEELINVLRELGGERSIDVLCSTHNPILLNSLGNQMLPFISYVKRDDQGASTISLLENKENLAKLMAANSLGGLMINDLL